ncbi:hypothetical protein JKP88DRAFT_268365 [Tribonema minus]|uniref:BTB domain-containing protein n=1 Tax=Tribonema minus TaxID=303371 RepID=A0A835ZAA9_9STRA|nr:hypothetical protein JKP88DRAFT_268365 [Tribonema minus]
MQSEDDGADPELHQADASNLVQLGGQPSDLQLLFDDMKNAARLLEINPVQSLRTVDVHAGEGPCSRVIRANWGVLSARVPMLSAMARGNWIETQGEGALTLSFPELNPNSIASLVQYAYAAVATVRRDGSALQDLLVAARYWQMDAVESGTVTAICSCLNPENAMDIISLSLQLGCDKLLRSAGAFICAGMDGILRGSAFLSSDEPAFRWLLQQPGLAVDEGLLAARALDWLACHTPSASGSSGSSGSGGRSCSSDAAAFITANITWCELSPWSLMNLHLHSSLAQDSACAISSCIARALAAATDGAAAGDDAFAAECALSQLRRRRSPVLQFWAGTGFVWERQVCANTRDGTHTPLLGPDGVLDLRRPGSIVKFMVTLRRQGHTWQHTVRSAQFAGYPSPALTHVAGTFDGTTLRIYVNSACSTRVVPDWGNEGLSRAHAPDSEVLPFDGDFCISDNATAVGQKVPCVIAALSLRLNRVLQPAQFLQCPPVNATLPA